MDPRPTDAGRPAGHEPTPELTAAARRRMRLPAVNLLLLVPLIATLLPGIYNRTTPRLFSIPFFYWYQLACIPVGVLCVVLVYRATRGDR